MLARLKILNIIILASDADYSLQVNAVTHLPSLEGGKLTKYLLIRIKQ